MLFIFDENFPPEFIKGFAILEKANRRSDIHADIVSSTEYMGKRSCTDIEIIQKANRKQAIIVTQDSDFKKIKHYKPLLQEHQVGFIYFKVPKGKYQYWDIVKAFVNAWDELKTSIANAEAPGAYEVNRKGQMQKLAF